MGEKRLRVVVTAQGVEAAEAKIARLDRRIDSTAAGASDAVGAIRAMHVSIGQLGATAATAMAALAGVGASLALVTGVRKAAEFRGIAISLEAVTGSARTANKLLGQLKALGKRTPFDTAELSAFAAQLLNAGTSAEHLTEELRTIADLAAFANVPRADLAEFMTNMAQIRRSLRPELEDLKQLFRRVPFAKLVSAGMGKSLNQQQAVTAIQGMSGEQAYQVILRGAEAMAKGAAAAAALRNPMAALANLFETLHMIMEPTGQLLLGVLMPLGAALQTVADKLVWINEFTKGLAGLGVVAYILVRAKNVLVGSYRLVLEEVRRLTAALTELAVSAGSAASASTGAAAAQGGAAGAAAAAAGAAAGRGKGARGGFDPNATAAIKPYGSARGAMRSAGVRGVGRYAAASLKGLGPKLLGWGSTALKVGKSATGIGLAALGLELGGNALGGKAGGILAGIGGGAGWGALAGGIIGSIVPVIGTTVGAAIGAAVGGVIGGVQAWRGQAETARKAEGADSRALQKIAQNTTQMAGDLRAQAVGGGARTSRALGEVDIILARMMASGMA